MTLANFSVRSDEMTEIGGRLRLITESPEVTETCRRDFH
jgi:hypothetical protein